jgi:F-type H+-transporting ATPase subunit delta
MKAKQKLKRDAKQLFHLCRVEGSLDENRAKQVVQGLIESGYRNRFQVLAEFQRLVRLEQLQHMAAVSSATPLAAELQSSLQEKLVQIYGPSLSVTFSVDPTLIGGIRIAAGDDVYDGSLRGRLAALETTFLT